LDFGNACGMSMMDYLGKDWSIKLVKAVAEGLPGGESTLRNKLLPIVLRTPLSGASLPILSKIWFLC